MPNVDLKKEPLKRLNLSEDEFLAILYAGKYTLEQQRTQGTLNQFLHELMNFIPTKYKEFIRKRLLRDEGLKPRHALLKSNLQYITPFYLRSPSIFHVLQRVKRF